MKRNNKLKTLCLLLLALPGITNAQQERTITLQEAIDLSIKNSKQLKGNEAKILEANTLIQQANEKRLPDASISGSYLYLPVSPNINLKTGGSDSSGGGGTPDVKQVVYGMASVSLPLYEGGKLKYGIESAKYLAQAVKLDADNDKDAIKLNTINAFINLYKAKKSIAVIKEDLEQSQQRVKEFSDLEKNGLLARNDLLKAELQSSNIELTLIDAESNWKLASVNMDLMLGLPETTALVADEASLEHTVEVKPIEEYEQAALQSRKDVTALSFRKKAATVGIKTAKAEYYPTIGLSAGYVAADIPNFLTVTNAINIGVGVKYNLSSLWKTKTNIQLAQSKVQQLSANEELLNDNIRLQINQAYQAFLLSQKKITVYEKAVAQSEENYRITKNKYDNTLATTTDLLDADVEALRAKLNAAVGKADVIGAYNKLLQTAGLLNN